MRLVVYLATPVRAASLDERRWNRLRAIVLARIAAAEGLAPVVPLLTVAGALEGFPDAPASAYDLNPMACCLSILRAVYVAGGRLWLLERADHGLSAGCAQELDAWRRWLSLEGGTRQQVPAQIRWEDLDHGRVEAAGLRPVWSLLSGPVSPDAIERAEQALSAHPDQPKT